MKILEQIDAYIHNEISDEELADFEKQLETDPSARQLYREYAGMVCGMESMARLTEEADLIAETPEEPPAPKMLTPRLWRFSMVAACILSSLLTTGAYALYVQDQLAELPLLRSVIVSLGFESDTVPILDRFPIQGGEWRSDGAVVDGDGDNAYEGKRYMQIASMATRRFSYFEGVVDLREQQAERKKLGATRIRLRCSAMVRTESFGDIANAVHTIRLGTYAEEPNDTSDAWRSGPAHEYAATYSRSRVKVKRGMHDWQLIEAIVDVPVDAQSAFVSVGIACGDDPNALHAVDNLQAEVIIER